MQTELFCTYALPPNTTHILQPADVSVFKPVKQEWKNTVSRWLSKPENINSSVTKLNFCTLFDESLRDTNTKPQIIKGFRKCGLFPLNPNNVDFTKCVRNTLEVQSTMAVEPKNVALNDHPVSLSDVETAKRVIKIMETQLYSYGINVEVIYNELNELKPQQEEPINPIISNNELTICQPENIFTELINEDKMADSDDIVLPKIIPTSSKNYERDLLTDSQNHINSRDEKVTKIPGKAKVKLPSAISSQAWRSYYLNKEKIKNEKAENIRKRKEQRIKSKKQKENRIKNIKKSKITKTKKNINQTQLKPKIKCVKCTEDLISDTEDDSEKNIGCDFCTKWYHLKCTEFMDLAYEAALGPVALSLVPKDTDDHEAAEKILMTCILSIILTAPTGALLLTLLGPHLLTKAVMPTLKEVRMRKKSRRLSLRDLTLPDMKLRDEEDEDSHRMSIVPEETQENHI
nr:unnamed protein product [Callosobruchus chinensis]